MRITLICLFLMVSGSDLSAQAHPGTVLVTGNVTIDGKPVQHSGNIFSGENLKTRDGAATITTEGVIASMGNHVSVLYGNDRVDMECGWVDVASFKSFAVRVHDVTATSSAEGLTKYEVRQTARTLSIHDVEGRVTVDDGKQKSTLNAGETRNFDRASRCAAAVAYAPWVAGGIFAASTTPIWLDPQNRHPITPSKP